MHRRDFLKTTAAATLASGGMAASATAADATALSTTTEAAAAPSAPAVHGGARTLLLASPFHDSSSDAGDAVRRLARRIELAAQGQWRIAWTGEAASSDVSIADLGSAASQHPAFTYFSGLPSAHALDIAGLEAWLTAGGGQDLWDDLAAGCGLKFLLAGHSGAGPTLWSRAPLVSPADLVGRSIALAGPAHALATGLGALPVDLDAEKVAEALAAGGVDIAETPDATPAPRAPLAAIAAHRYPSPFQPHGTTIALAIRHSLWEGFTVGERIVLESLAAESLAHTRAQHAAERATRAALAGTLPDCVPRLQPLSEDIARGVSTIAASFIAGIAGHDQLSRRIDHSYMTFRRASARRGPSALS